MSFAIYLFLHGVIRKYGRKAHTSGLHRDINLSLIFLRLEGSTSHTNEREAERARKQGARPVPLGAPPPMVANQGASHGLCSVAFEDQGEPFNQGRFDPTTQIHLRGLYNQGP